MHNNPAVARGPFSRISRSKARLQGVYLLAVDRFEYHIVVLPKSLFDADHERFQPLFETRRADGATFRIVVKQHDLSRDPGKRPVEIDAQMVAATVVEIWEPGLGPPIWFGEFPGIEQLAKRSPCRTDVL
jgi:hypothetical protein